MSTPTRRPGWRWRCVFYGAVATLFAEWVASASSWWFGVPCGIALGAVLLVAEDHPDWL